jgi:ATP synthase protein I
MTTEGPNGFLDTIRRNIMRLKRARTEGEPSLSGQFAQVGVLGWIVVTPALIGVFLGRWLDGHFHMGVFWTAALLFLGAAFGFWSAWRWMHTR